MDKVVCLFAFVSKKHKYKYLNYALKLITKIQSESNLPIIILTDSKGYFDDMGVEVLYTFNPSFTDKVTLCEYALRFYDTAVYVDVDTTLDFKLLEQTKFEKGFHFWWWWKVIWRAYNQLEDKRYFKSLEDYCVENGLNIHGAQLIHEGFFVFRKSKGIKKFFEIYDKLAPVAIQNDLLHKKYPTGRAEGLLIGIALANSKYKSNGCSDSMKLLGHQLHQDKSKERKNMWDSIDNPNKLQKKTMI